MFEALESFVAKNTQWSKLRKPYAVEGLPLSEGRALLDDLCSFYPKTTKHKWGIILLISLLCRSELAYLLRQYKDATPAELLLLLRDGILRGEQPRDFARQQLFEDARTESERRLIPIPEESLPKTLTLPTDSVSLLDLERAWPVLTQEEQEVLRLSLDGYKGQALAAKLGVSSEAAEQRLTRARSHLAELMGREI